MMKKGVGVNKRFFLAVLSMGLLAAAGCAQADWFGSSNKEWVESKSGIAFMWVPAGCFQMGGYDTSFEQPVHKVCVKGFWMGKYEVTQEQYLKVAGSNPGRSSNMQKPVSNVSWDDAAHFAATLSGSTSLDIRLPSEAEWEYACRAGKADGAYCGDSAEYSRLAWHKGNSNRGAQQGGKLEANAWGLYDMSGNLWEWTQDCWHESFAGAPADGSAWTSGACNKRVLRGGSWCNDQTYLNAAFRFGNFKDGGECAGFRVVLIPK